MEGGAPAQTRPERVIEKPNKPPLSEGHTSRSGEGSMEYHFELTDNVPPIPHDSPLSEGHTSGSDDGRMKLIKELMETNTSLTKRVLALEEAKTAHRQVSTDLNIGGFETSTDTSLGKDASKQGRSSDKTKPITARPEVSVATPSTPLTTSTVFDDKDVTMAMAQTMINMNLRIVLLANVPFVKGLPCFSSIAKESTVTPIFESLELSANVNFTASTVAFEHNEEMVNAEVDGSDPKMTDDTTGFKVWACFCAMGYFLVALDDFWS
ncbi:hypothetical protein Tco_0180271 [Tanacetum coccineum]